VAGQCSSSCPGGQTLCAGKCVDITTDIDNCGACGNACPASHVCENQTCKLVCASALTDCSGKCVQLQNDEMNCGSCGAQCSVGYECLGGKCELSCTAGLTNCGNVCVDLQADNSHCGGCNATCTAPEVCTTGSCTCPSPTVKCSGQCVNTQVDPKHCGACGQMCATAQSCQGGQCVAGCNSTTNLALTATPTSIATSGQTSTGYGPELMKDGKGEADCSSLKFHWVKATSGPGWTEYAWTTPQTVGRITIDTGTSCTSTGRNLSGATIQWYNGTSWVTAGTVSGETGDWSFTFNSPVVTTKIRLDNVQSGETNKNPVIYEWSVFAC
jgi:hypothetical protein